MVLFIFAGCKVKSEDVVQTPEITEAVNEAEETVAESDSEYEELEEYDEPESKPDKGFETRKASNWKTAYKYYLEDYDNYIKDLYPISEGFTNKIRFWLDYLNHDDVPELFVSTGVSHANGVKVIFYNKSTQSIDVYPKNDDSNYSNCGYGGYGCVNYVRKENKIISANFGQGARRTHVCDLSSGKEVVIWSGYSVYPEMEDEVTKEKYMVNYDEHFKGTIVSRNEYEIQFIQNVPKETIYAPASEEETFKTDPKGRKYKTESDSCKLPKNYIEYLFEDTYSLTQTNIDKVLK